jgi:hypothetical protein
VSGSGEKFDVRKRCTEAVERSIMTASFQQVEPPSEDEEHAVGVTVSDGAERIAVVPPKWSRTIARG